MRKGQGCLLPGGREMLVISLRAANFGFWSPLHVGCSAIKKNHYIQPQRSSMRRNLKVCTCICLFSDMISFRGQNSLDHPKITLLQLFNSKFLTSIPTPFIYETPRCLLSCIVGKPRILVRLAQGVDDKMPHVQLSTYLFQGALEKKKEKCP